MNQPLPSICRLLLDAADHAGSAIALMAPGRQPLSYSGLADLLRQCVNELQSCGIGRGDRVAMVLPNGPEMVTAFFGVAAVATAAPLNPAYQAAEFDFYLSDLNPQALILESGQATPARDIARSRGIPIIELVPERTSAAGLFHLHGKSQPCQAKPGLAEADEIALVLHTSGTTSRPKIVPLSQANLCASALNIARTLQLTRADRVLNVMPLFHIHGLVAATLAPLSAAGSVVCTPGFFAPQFFEWLDEFQPTWYSAVPTMHQAILARAASEAKTAGRAPLRLIRSSSAALPPQVMGELERTFGVPVIEAYGMTEAAHQMASNPLPPLSRKPGSVGRAAGPDMSIMNNTGELLPAGQVGEIVIRGANVTRGYESNPAANKDAFFADWFRTGDQGYLDSEGYLFITGRLKEQINRGGEKLSPREIDEVLLDHPAIAQAVTFAMPHPTLGEDVAAAVVLRTKGAVTESEIRQFVIPRLSHFKVPRRVVILDEIPKGPTGKIQRIGLAARLGLTAAPGPVGQRAEYVGPQTLVEQALAAIWEQVLNVCPVGSNDDFLQLGGDSILGTQLMARVEESFGVSLHLITLFEAATVGNLATMIEVIQASVDDPELLLVQMNELQSTDSTSRAPMGHERKTA